MILTVSRIEAEKKANPGYRAFLANGFNVTRILVLIFWEVVLEMLAASSAAKPRRAPARTPRRHLSPASRRAVRLHPRPDRLRGPDRHDEGPARRLRDVLELRRGRPPLRARARGHARGAPQARPALRAHRPRPPLCARARTRSWCLSDHGQTQGATFKQRNGYGLDDLVERSLASGNVTEIAGGDEQSSMVGHALNEATGKKGKTGEERRLGQARGRARVGQPGAHLPDGGAAPVDARGDRSSAIHASSPRCASTPTWAGCSSARASTAPSCSAGRDALPGRRTGRGRRSPRVVLADRGPAPAADGRVPPRRRHHGRQLLRSRAPTRGCAFEELISFHGGIGGPQDEAVHPSARRAAAAEQDRRRRRGSRGAERPAAGAERQARLSSAAPFIPGGRCGLRPSRI